MALWVDTDMGFDDLWALLLLNHLQTTVDGVSLVAGNTPLAQVKKNSQAAIKAFGFHWPVFAGAEKPLQREPETAERILGKFGMQTRGSTLPYDEVLPGDATLPHIKSHVHNQTMSSIDSSRMSAIDAMAYWLRQADEPKILALGPLTNVAQLYLLHPHLASNITQITWLGGSSGRGNHSAHAEYNALADPEALAVVAKEGTALRMIDLELCRQVSFDESNIPLMQGKNKHLLTDLLGGYLDIALQRGRKAMSIYDPLAALAVVNESLFTMTSATLDVHTIVDPEYGRTIIRNAGKASRGKFEIAIDVDATAARDICLSSLVSA